MIQNDNLAVTGPVHERSLRFQRDNVSGVSWAAVFAGAAAAAALSLILLMLGLGLGFSAISPWSHEGVGATTITVSTAIWLALTQIIASGMGGYLAGRLRMRWTAIHTDEVYFRDTAHGMLSWAVATLVTAAFLSSALAGIVGAGTKAVGSAATSSVTAVAQGAAANADKMQGNPMDYFVDTLFRADQPNADQTASNMPANDGAKTDRIHREATTILVRSVTNGSLDPADKTYLAKLVAQQTGISQSDAEKRIDTLYSKAQEQAKALETKAKEVADATRKAAAAASLWIFISLLCGAFFASLAAIWGGRRRDLAVIDEPYTA